MKLLNKLSLRMRLTLLTGVIIFCVSIGLTLTSMYNAQDKIVGMAAATVTSSAEYNNVQALTTSLSSTPVTTSAKPLDSTVILPSLSPEDKDALLEWQSTNAANATAQFNAWSYIYLLIILVLGMGATYFICGRALNPVKALSNAVTDIDRHNLSRRIEAPLQNGELQTLSNSFNDMLDRLESSFERQQRFTANAAHELKTPLATVKAGIQVLHLDDSPSIEDYAETVKIIEQSTDSLISIVNNLLVLASDSQEGFTDEMEIGSIFNQVLVELEPKFLEKNISVNIIQPNKFNLVGNKTLIYRAFFNLIENSIKYTPSNGRLEISIEKHQNNIIVKLKDNGVGIEKEDISLIFEPFYRVDPSRSHQVGGFGLGLSIVKSIIEQHNGTILVESEKGTGTVFTITMPSTPQ